MDQHEKVMTTYCSMCGSRLPDHKEDCPTITRFGKVERHPVLRMRTASGNVETKDRLAVFLYLLARDNVPSGTIDKIIDYEIPQHKDTGFQFTNGWMAEWAKDASARLTRE